MALWFPWTFLRILDAGSLALKQSSFSLWSPYNDTSSQLLLDASTSLALFFWFAFGWNKFFIGINVEVFWSKLTQVESRISKKFFKMASPGISNLHSQLGKSLFKSEPHFSFMDSLYIRFTMSLIELFSLLELPSLEGSCMPFMHHVPRTPQHVVFFCPYVFLIPHRRLAWSLRWASYHEKFSLVQCHTFIMQRLFLH